VFFVLCFSGNAYAEDKEGIAKWFLNNDQQALQAIKSGRYKEAKKQAESQHLKGSAHYKLGEYEEAAKKFFGHDLYNYGNALALTGKYEEAIAAYKKAIELNPKHDDAKHNKEVLEKLMQQQNQSQNDKDKNQKGGQEQEQNGKDNKDGQKDKAQEKDKQSESEAEAEAKPEAEPENDTSGNEKDNQKTEEEKGKQKADRKKNEPMEQDKNPQQESVKFDEKDQAQQNLLRQIEGGSTDFLREKLKLDYLKKKGYNF
jgi:Ca-activated chloride channel family protein